MNDFFKMKEKGGEQEFESVNRGQHFEIKLWVFSQTSG